MEEAVNLAAKLLEMTARTAPKSAGKDYLEITTVSGPDVERLADDMLAVGEETGKRNFDRDGDSVRRSQAVVLFALKDARTLGLNCGACGQPRCQLLEDQWQEGPEFAGPACTWRIVDLGIAIGSACKMAGIFGVDSRVLYRAGVSARRLGMVAGDVVLGLPLAATGKSPYFDRG